MWSNRHRQTIRETIGETLGTAALWLILAALCLWALYGCGGSGSSGQGDKPVGDGQNVQKSQAVVVIHRAGGDEVRDYGEKP